MHKLVLGFIGLMISINAFAITLDSLDDHAIFKGLYPKTFSPLFNEKAIEDVRGANVGVELNNQEYLASYPSIEQYKNKDGEVRYLVHIERREIQLHDEEFINEKYVKIPNPSYEFAQTCLACSSEDDLFIFKKNQNAKYELVSKNKDTLRLGVYGLSQFDISDLSRHIINIKNDTVGFFFTISVESRGFLEEHRSAIVLNEKSPINKVIVGLSAQSNEDSYEDESLKSSYDSTAKILENEPTNFGFYPIEVKFTFSYKKGKKLIKEYKVARYEMQKDRENYKDVTSRDE